MSKSLPKSLEDLDKMPMYSIEIDCGGRECDRYTGRWANYGLISAEGHTLSELLDNAVVDIMDQDGGELDVVAADESWMVAQIETEYKRLIAKVLAH